MNERHGPEHQLAELTRDDRAMMLNPQWWPIQIPSPQLALKHRTETYGGDPHDMPRHARLFPRPDGSYLVFRWRADNPFLTESEPIIYTTVDDVLAAGWIVD